MRISDCSSDVCSSDLSQVERDGDSRELALVVDGQIPCFRCVDRDETGQRHLLPRKRRGYIQLVEQVRIFLKPGRHFQNNLIDGYLREVLRHLPLAAGVIVGGVDKRRRNTETKTEERRVG